MNIRMCGFTIATINSSKKGDQCFNHVNQIVIHAGAARVSKHVHFRFGVGVCLFNQIRLVSSFDKKLMVFVRNSKLFAIIYLVAYWRAQLLCIEVR